MAWGTLGLVFGIIPVSAKIRRTERDVPSFTGIGDEKFLILYFTFSGIILAQKFA